MVEKHKNMKVSTQINLYLFRDREGAVWKYHRSQKLPRKIFPVIAHPSLPCIFLTWNARFVIPWSWGHIFSISSVWCSRIWESSLKSTLIYLDLICNNKPTIFSQIWKILSAVSWIGNWYSHEHSAAESDLVKWALQHVSTVQMYGLFIQLGDYLM